MAIDGAGIGPGRAPTGATSPSRWAPGTTPPASPTRPLKAPAASATTRLSGEKAGERVVWREERLLLDSGGKFQAVLEVGAGDWSGTGAITVDNVAYTAGGGCEEGRQESDGEGEVQCLGDLGFERHTGAYEQRRPSSRASARLPFERGGPRTRDSPSHSQPQRQPGPELPALHSQDQVRMLELPVGVPSDWPLSPPCWRVGLDDPRIPFGLGTEGGRYETKEKSTAFFPEPLLLSSMK
ncbi:endosomal glycoproteinglycoprotein-like-like [Podarcis lilfordi]|uniref:Endosomal glycoproteinglycoprotein-like-like n=1 Tax=Podarcis lilfordi TaxID=74358 RepID=A0AA35PRQ0_9SAUR|nr:endosomal glycoproteinglycoprotein-like-like [Podarcis lilfordi]